ncbi:MAG: M3 family oligoendopeptidase [bacterium]
MSRPPVPFSQMKPARPTIEGLTAAYAKINEAFDNATDAAARLEAVYMWDRVRRSYTTWSSITHLKFMQNTKDEAAKAEREYSDELSPKVTELDINMMRKLLDAPGREDLAAVLGEHAFLLWESAVTTYEPAIQDDLVAENKLAAKFTELQASAEIEFNGETYNLSSLGKFAEVADRDVRHGSMKARWDWVAAHGDEFDQIYDDLVKVRHKMAQKLGYENYIELGYRRMTRVDYTQNDVEVFRKQVVEHVVPLVTLMHEDQRKRLGVDTLMAWDEPVFDLTGNPRPEGDVAELTLKAATMFDAMHPELGAFYHTMMDNGLLDLDTRPGKAGGGFCTSFADFGVPFIFATFNGSKHDAEVFTHEMGHAFQVYVSMDKVLSDYFWPTYESCEIHSMSLEFFTWPHMDLFFGGDTERFKKIHLAESLSFLPYGVAVDHFQHLVYANPDATPAERRQMWKDMEATYLP